MKKKKLLLVHTFAFKSVVSTVCWLGQRSVIQNSFFFSFCLTLSSFPIWIRVHLSIFLYPLLCFYLGFWMVFHNLVLLLRLSKLLKHCLLLSPFPLLPLDAMERRVRGTKHKHHGLKQEQFTRNSTEWRKQVVTATILTTEGTRKRQAIYMETPWQEIILNCSLHPTDLEENPFPILRKLHKVV